MTVRNGFAVLLIAAGAMIAALGASASDAPPMSEEYGGITYTTVRGDFGDVESDVENAILNRGLVIDYHGYIGDMLERTGADVGSDTAIYSNAESLQFCSATLSRAMMEADPRNIGFCPYTIVVYELAASPGEIHIGYRAPGKAGSDASLAALGAIDALLAEIIAAAKE